MYLPENHDQMFDILAELRTYAATSGMTDLAEKLDDALVVLAMERRRSGSRPTPASQDRS